MLFCGNTAKGSQQHKGPQLGLGMESRALLGDLGSLQLPSTPTGQLSLNSQKQPRPLNNSHNNAGGGQSTILEAQSLGGFLVWLWRHTCSRGGGVLWHSCFGAQGPSEGGFFSAGMGAAPPNGPTGQFLTPRRIPVLLECSGKRAVHPHRQRTYTHAHRTQKHTQNTNIENTCIDRMHMPAHTDACTHIEHIGINTHARTPRHPYKTHNTDSQKQTHIHT